MALIEKVSQEELYLYEIMRNPVLNGEFIENIDKVSWEEKFEYTYYQKEILCDFNSFISICTGRAVGKTLALVAIIRWILIYNVFPNDYILYTVPSKVHLQPVWNGLIRTFRSNSLLKNFIKDNAGFNSSAYEITLLNRSGCICRIAGQTGTGANVIGLHTPFELLDEGGYYPWGAWTELQPTLNTFTQGFRLTVSGVPTGIRENNVLYTTDQEDSNYTKHRVSAYENPRFSEEDELHAEEQYGGKDSDDFLHLVRGLHGSPVFAIFDRNAMQIDNYPVYKLTMDGMEMGENLDKYLTKLSMFPLPPSNKGVIFGVDLGFTEPTAIIILYLDSQRILRIHGRIQLNKVSYNLQDRIIDALDTRMNPSIVSVDEGSTGKAVIQRMRESVDFITKGYDKKMIAINFASWISLGFNSLGEEIKERCKPLAVTVLQEFSNNHKIIYSTTDLELITELERMTYTKNINGEISYRTLTVRGGKRGEDHFTSALLCAVLAYYLENETLFVRKTLKLFNSRWLLT